MSSTALIPDGLRMRPRPVASYLHPRPASLRAPVGNQLIGEIHARGQIGEHPLKPLCERPGALRQKGPVRFYAQDQPVSLLQIQPVPYLRRQHDPPPVSEALPSERCRVGHR